MFNSIDFRETPTPVDGVGPGETSRDVLGRYAEPLFRFAFRRGAHPVMGGLATAEALDIWGIEGAERWDQGGLVRYRSRRDMMEFVVFLNDLETRGENIHRFKFAALEKHTAVPLDPWFQLGDPRLVLGLLFLTIGLALDVRRLSRAVSARAG